MDEVAFRALHHYYFIWFLRGDPAIEKVRESIEKQWPIRENVHQAMDAERSVGLDPESFFGQIAQLVERRTENP